jgi:phospholipid/cholesterol/gamma-HCH transport system substrate-binding protein
MNDQAVRFRLGIFVLSALILLAVLIMLFGGWGRVFQHYNEYTIVFDNAAGVAAGTPVRRSGVKIGEVQSVELDSKTGEVRVRIKVASDYVVRKNDVATITRNLLGDTSIDFVPNNDQVNLMPGEGGEQPVLFQQGQAAPQPPDTSPVPPGSTLRGRSSAQGGNLAQQGAELVPAAREMINQLTKMLPLVDETLREYRQLGKLMSGLLPAFSKTNEEIQLMARNWGKLGERLDVLLQSNDQKLTKALDQLNESLRRLNTTFSDENQKNLTDTLKNVRESSNRLDSITRNTDDLIKESRKTMTQINSSVSRANDVMNNLQQATQPLAERTPTIMRNLDESSAKLNALLTNLSGVFNAFGRGDGTLQRLLNDPSLYNHLNDAACMIARTVPRLDRALADLEIFADKLARHPEAIGLGGVVRPSVGLKEAPTTSPTWQGVPGH